MPSADPADWAAPTSVGPVDATVVLPGSKSLTNRYLVIAALAQDPSRLRRPLRSRDTELMAGALRTLGVRVDDLDGDDWLITPSAFVGGGQRRLRTGRQCDAVRPPDCGLGPRASALRR
jgi:3-phosphoshikimate 1-carboxyvinyltransferase